MLKDIVDVKPLPEYRLHLRFEDGVQGIIDVSAIIEFVGVFEPLKDPNYFTSVSVNPEWGTIYWPSGADLDPDKLYSAISGEPLPDFEAITAENPSD